MPRRRRPPEPSDREACIIAAAATLSKIKSWRQRAFAGLIRPRQPDFDDFIGNLYQEIMIFRCFRAAFRT
jgi:hypothetical protein